MVSAYKIPKNKFCPRTPDPAKLLIRCDYRLGVFSEMQGLHTPRTSWPGNSLRVFQKEAASQIRGRQGAGNSRDRSRSPGGCGGAGRREDRGRAPVQSGRGQNPRDGSGERTPMDNPMQVSIPTGSEAQRGGQACSGGKRTGERIEQQQQ